MTYKHSYAWILMFLLLSFVFNTKLSAQTDKNVAENYQPSTQLVAIKSNFLYDVTGSMNLGVELGINRKWSIDLSGNLNPWGKSNQHTFRHWMIQPELRYWFCEPFNGHFLALQTHTGKYNLGGIENSLKLFQTDFSQLSDNRFEGWFVGGGIAYGYSWILSRHWNLEVELGLGYAYSKYAKYPCSDCGTKIDDGKHHYIGPTKTAFNLLFIF